MNKKYPLVASDAFLSQNIDTLNKYSAVEEFADALGDGNDKNLRGIEYHLIQLRNDLRKRLVAKQIFIGTSIIEEVIFNCARNGASDSVNAAFKLINSSVVASPGLIIYPLNSFGILGVAGCVLRGEEFPTFVLPDCGIALIPQQNSIEKVKRRISEMVSELGVRAKLDERLFEHYHVSRDLKWLENNPLLFVKVRQFQDYFHENQFFVVRKTLFARLLVYMLHVLQDDPDTDVEPLWSTSRVNNWETLDCKHYLLLQRDPRSASKLSVNCVPMNIDRAELTEMCELNANINRQAWQRKEKRFNQVVLAVKQFEKIYFGNIFRTNKNNQWRRLLERLERSIRYFTRSFRNSSLTFDSNVYL
ncbi:MAG TPA: hypothetical protein PLH57_06405, partial [Oligoflexia bacterium]|nr:hypothetical protein [Oligoflexia bacterium]